MATKKELEDVIALYKEQVSFLKEQNTLLLDEKEKYRLQIEKLQDAIINIRAPEAYRDLVADRAELESRAELGEIDREYLERQRQIKEVEKTWLSNLERPLFKNADDMAEMLGSSLLRTPPESKSIHENSES